VPAPSLALLLVLATLCGGSAPSGSPAPRDEELAAGISLVKDGDFANAVVTLDAAVRRLEAAGRSAEAAQAFLFLGVAYLELDQEALARGKFAQALARKPQMSLDPGEFSPQVIRTFEATRQEALPPPTIAGREAAEQQTRPRAAPYLILGGAALAAGGVALASGGGSGSEPSPGPSPSPSPVSTPPPAPPACTFEVSPPGLQTVPAEGGRFFCDVLTQSPCAWTAESTEPWLLLTTLGPRQGNGRVGFIVRANNSGSRRDADVRVIHDDALATACRVRQLPAASSGSGVLASWESDLAVPGGSARVLLDGAFVGVHGPGAAAGARVLGAGVHRFEALLVTGQERPGVWRFRLGSGFRAGTLRVLAGEAALPAADTIVFRFRGRPGERAAFSVEAGPTPGGL
jgi:hypothetical protein